MRKRTEDPAQRFWRKVDKTPTCWLWTGAAGRGGRSPYGVFAAGHRHTTYAHRWAWEQLRGPIPEGMVLDHLCGVHNCVNPDHLEPVTVNENGRRRPHRAADTTPTPAADPQLALRLLPTPMEDEEWYEYERYKEDAALRSASG